MQRFNLEAIIRSSRTPSSIDQRGLIVMSQPSFVKGHKHSISGSSTLTDSSLATISSTRSSQKKVKDYAVIVDADATDGVDVLESETRPGSSSSQSPYNTFQAFLKSILSSSSSPRSQDKPRTRRHLMWTRPGSLDLTQVDKLLKKHKGEEVVTFQTVENAHVAYGRLAETVDHLAASTIGGSVRHVHLVSQMYTLEELHLVTSAVTRFQCLTKLALFDAADDPPDDHSALCAIVVQWGVACPSLQEVQFERGKIWVRDDGEEKEKPVRQWVEREVETA